MVVIGLRPRCLSVVKTLMRIAWVDAPLSLRLLKLFFRMITASRMIRSAELFSNGTLCSSTKVVKSAEKGTRSSAEMGATYVTNNSVG